jgi:predicted Ser/Thr protein kinase
MDPDAPVAGDLNGKQLGDFRLLRRLGQGGMGQVYLAEQISLKRKVAIKIMRTDLPVTAASFERFRAEAEAVARITHANIVQVYSFAEEDGLHYMALEYVEGRNLREYLDKKGPPDLPIALSIMRQVAAALQRAGELGVIHRDIKPENILLTRRGEVKVTDFGLSRCFVDEPGRPHLTQSGIAMGTPLYMSPEQIQGEALDPRTDIYSFGVTCYQMLAGQLPFRGQNPFELAMQHVQQEPEPLTQLRPDLPAELCAMVHRMMAKTPGQRYQACGELLKDLARLRESLAGQPTLISGNWAKVLPEQAALSSTPTAPTARATRPASATVLGVAGTILLALLGGGTLAWLHERAGSRQPAVVAPQDADAVLTELQKQEKFLREAVEQYANPAGERGRLELGLRHCLELGQFYLKHNRLTDADQFFTSLMKNSAKIEAYRTLGRLGHAIVLAKQDRPVESNRAFLDVLRDKSPQGRPPDRLPFLLNQPEWRSYIGRALDQNQANAPGQALPTELKAIRDPPQATKKG